jgi:DNA-binding transcriptional MocR family regulator
VSERYQITGDSSARISASVESGVRTGALPAGAGLPPVRALADRLGVSPATVAKAYQSLRQRGVVETAGRNGTRIRARPAIAASRAAARPPVPLGVRDLSTGEPDARLLPDLDGALRRVAAAAPRPVNYAQGGTLPELVTLARRRFSADGVPMRHAELAITAGALDGFERLLTAHLRPGDRIVVEDPCWANLLDLVAALGLRPIGLAVDDDGPVPDSLRSALAAGARAVVVTTRAQNPTGASVTRARATALRRVLKDHPDVLVVEDDHLGELATVPLHSLAGATPSWAFLRSVSKPYGPDLRLAALAGDEATVARVVGRMRLGTAWVSTLLQRVVVELWRDNGAARRVAAAGREYDERRRALLDALHAQDLTASGRTGINVWVRVADETSAVTRLRDSGYAVAPGSLYRLSGGPPAIRITVSTLELSAARSLADAVAQAVSAVPSRAFA